MPRHTSIVEGVLNAASMTDGPAPAAAVEDVKEKNCHQKLSPGFLHNRKGFREIPRQEALSRERLPAHSPAALANHCDEKPSTLVCSEQALRL